MKPTNREGTLPCSGSALCFVACGRTALLRFVVCFAFIIFLLSLPTWLAAIGERNELCMSCHAEIDLTWMLRPATGTG